MQVCFRKPFNTFCFANIASAWWHELEFKRHHSTCLCERGYPERHSLEVSALPQCEWDVFYASKPEVQCRYKLFRVFGALSFAELSYLSAVR